MLIPVEEIVIRSKSCQGIIKEVRCSTRGSYDQKQQGKLLKGQAQGVSLEKLVLASITYWERQCWRTTLVTDFSSGKIN